MPQKEEGGQSHGLYRVSFIAARGIYLIVKILFLNAVEERQLSAFRWQVSETTTL